MPIGAACTATFVTSNSSRTNTTHSSSQLYPEPETITQAELELELETPIAEDPPYYKDQQFVQGWIYCSRTSSHDTSRIHYLQYEPPCRPANTDQLSCLQRWVRWLAPVAQLQVQGQFISERLQQQPPLLAAHAEKTSAYEGPPGRDDYDDLRGPDLWNSASEPTVCQAIAPQSSYSTLTHYVTHYSYPVLAWLQSGLDALDQQLRFPSAAADTTAALPPPLTAGIRNATSVITEQQKQARLAASFQDMRNQVNQLINASIPASPSRYIFRYRAATDQLFEILSQAAKQYFESAGLDPHWQSLQAQQWLSQLGVVFALPTQWHADTTLEMVKRQIQTHIVERRSTDFIQIRPDSPLNPILNTSSLQWTKLAEQEAFLHLIIHTYCERYYPVLTLSFLGELGQITLASTEHAILQATMRMVQAQNYAHLIHTNTELQAMAHALVELSPAYLSLLAIELTVLQDPIPMHALSTDRQIQAFIKAAIERYVTAHTQSTVQLAEALAELRTKVLPAPTLDEIFIPIAKRKANITLDQPVRYRINKGLFVNRIKTQPMQEALSDIIRYRTTVSVLKRGNASLEWSVVPTELDEIGPDDLYDECKRQLQQKQQAISLTEQYAALNKTIDAWIRKYPITAFYQKTPGRDVGDGHSDLALEYKKWGRQYLVRMTYDASGLPIDMQDCSDTQNPLECLDTAVPTNGTRTTTASPRFTIAHFTHPDGPRALLYRLFEKIQLLPLEARSAQIQGKMHQLLGVLTAEEKWRLVGEVVASLFFGPVWGLKNALETHHSNAEESEKREAWAMFAIEAFATATISLSAGVRAGLSASKAAFSSTTLRTTSSNIIQRAHLGSVLSQFKQGLQIAGKIFGTTGKEAVRQAMPLGGNWAFGKAKHALHRRLASSTDPTAQRLARQFERLDRGLAGARILRYMHQHFDATPQPGFKLKPHVKLHYKTDPRSGIAYLHDPDLSVLNAKLVFDGKHNAFYQTRGQFGDHFFLRAQRLDPATMRPIGEFTEIIPPALPYIRADGSRAPKAMPIHQIMELKSDGHTIHIAWNRGQAQRLVATKDAYRLQAMTPIEARHFEPLRASFEEHCFLHLARPTRDQHGKNVINIANQGFKRIPELDKFDQFGIDLTQVQTIKASGNSWRSFPHHLPQRLTQLETFDLRHCGLIHIPSLIDDFKHKATFDLRGNSIPAPVITAYKLERQRSSSLATVMLDSSSPSSRIIEIIEPDLAATYQQPIWDVSNAHHRFQVMRNQHGHYHRLDQHNRLHDLSRAEKHAFESACLGLHRAKRTPTSARLGCAQRARTRSRIRADDELDLRDQDLEQLPSLPPGLTKLDASYNKLSGQLAHLDDSIQECNLEFNHFTSFSNLPFALEIGNFANNKFQKLPTFTTPSTWFFGFFKTYILKNPKLRMLRLENNQLTDLPDDIFNLPSRCVVYLEGNPLRRSAIIKVINHQRSQTGPHFDSLIQHISPEEYGQLLKVEELSKTIAAWYDNSVDQNAIMKAWQDKPISPKNMELFNEFLGKGRLQGTALYKQAHARQFVTQWLDELNHNQRLLDKSLAVCSRIENSCEDRASVGWNYMQRERLNLEIENEGRRYNVNLPALIKKSRIAYRLEQLDMIVTGICYQLTLRDFFFRKEIEVFLYYQVKLKSFLNLPASMAPEIRYQNELKYEKPSMMAWETVGSLIKQKENEEFASYLSRSGAWREALNRWNFYKLQEAENSINQKIYDEDYFYSKDFQRRVKERLKGQSIEKQREIEDTLEKEIKDQILIPLSEAFLRERGGARLVRLFKDPYWN